MYTVTLTCTGIPSAAGPQAALDITAEFRERRTWHQNVQCTWDGSRLLLQAQSDFDSNGLALQDEFSDCIAAYIAEPFYGEIKVLSITSHLGETT